MSSLALQVPAGLSITGGVPVKSQDFAASLVFTIAYASLVPLTIFCLAHRNSRNMALIHPAIFVQVRVATYVVRIIQANRNYSRALFIAKQVLLLAGFPIICEAILTLLGYHIARKHHSTKGRKVAQQVIRFLRLTIIAALIIAVIAGAQFSSALDDPTKLDSLCTLRTVNGALRLAIVLSALGIAAFTQVHMGLLLMPTVYLGLMGACLAIAAAYCLAMIYIKTPPLDATTKVEFYLLLALTEWLVALLLFGVNIKLMFTKELKWETSETKSKERPLGSSS